MIRQASYSRAPSPPSLLIAAHCATIRRKAERIDVDELRAILSDLVRELKSRPLRPATYLNSLGEILRALHSKLPPSIVSLTSHPFFLVIRTNIGYFLQQLYRTYKLKQQEIHVVRHCVSLFEQLIKQMTDLSKIRVWITDVLFLDALGNCLQQIDSIHAADDTHLYVKQIMRLVNMFANIQERLPADLHGELFARLFQPTINCLTSTTYVELFRGLRADANAFSPIEKLFLIKCSYFLTSYNGHLFPSEGRFEHFRFSS